MDNKDFLPIFAQFQMLWKLLQTKDNYDSSVAQQARFCSADFLLPRNKGVEALNVMCRRFVFIAEKKCYSTMTSINPWWMKSLTICLSKSWLDKRSWQADSTIKKLLTKTFLFSLRRRSKREVEQKRYWMTDSLPKDKTTILGIISDSCYFFFNFNNRICRNEILK